MTKTISAIYENGVFRPEEPLELTTGSRVDVVIRQPNQEPWEKLRLRLKAKFPNSFGTVSREDGEEMMRVINERFQHLGTGVEQ
jgi:predicted DNA-binding antitoxin AbrB/MazE fold protein